MNNQLNAALYPGGGYGSFQCLRADIRSCHLLTLPLSRPGPSCALVVCVCVSQAGITRGSGGFNWLIERLLARMLSLSSPCCTSAPVTAQPDTNHEGPAKLFNYFRAGFADPPVSHTHTNVSTVSLLYDLWCMLFSTYSTLSAVSCSIWVLNSLHCLKCNSELFLLFHYDNWQYVTGTC